MAGKILSGNIVAEALKIKLKQRVDLLKTQGIMPKLVTVVIGNDRQSHTYVKYKRHDCLQVGIDCEIVAMSEQTTQKDVINIIKKLNIDKSVTGYIVQLPLPKHINTQTIISNILPEKDADGLHPLNLGNLILNSKDKIYTPKPCTPSGILSLLHYYKISLKNKYVVIIGRGLTVGKPIGLLLMQHSINATTTTVHTGTNNIFQYLKDADVIISAAGSAHMIKAHHLKRGVIVIDVGISYINSPTGRQILGDVDPEVINIASWLSPNPGGIGPMTRAMLLNNIIDIAESYKY